MSDLWGPYSDKPLESVPSDFLRWVLIQEEFLTKENIPQIEEIEAILFKRTKEFRHFSIGEVQMPLPLNGRGL